MAIKKPQVVFGAVYYRRTNPPVQDWARDYQQATADGMNMFRHWFLWGATEIRPGEFDWSKYDEHMDLAAKNGIGTIIAEVQNIPEWLYYERPDLLRQKADGNISPSSMGNSTVVGGFVPDWLCWDNPEARQYTERYLRELATHFKGHPSLYAYDIDNECHYSRGVCHCPHTQAAFREWLLAKYGSLEALAEAWHRYSFTDWKQVMAPRVIAQFPDCLDWQEFCKQRAYENMQWRHDIIRSVDPDVRITAHGLAGSLDTYASGSDDWLAASKVESYGFTFVACRKGNDKWKHWNVVDLTRAASRGKDFWHSEMQGGPLWLQPQVIGREPEDGRIATGDDVRMWSMISLAGGARGLMWTRWRALLDGPLFGAFGLYSNDGTANDRSQSASELGKWANSEKTAELMASKPVKGDIGIIVHDKIQDFNRTMQQAGEGRFFTRCMWGAYRAFEAQNIQADWVHFDDIAEYETLYFPYPIHLSKEDAQRLADWVANGGTLISEGMPGYFGEGTHVGAVQPNHGLNEIFGVLEETAEFMPDIGNRISFDWEGIGSVPGGLYRQSYKLNGAKCLAKYGDGRIAAVSHAYGKGKTVLIGTFPSEAYNRTESKEVEQLFAQLLKSTGAAQLAATDNRDVTVRVSENDGVKFVWAINHCYETVKTAVTVAGGEGVAETLWGGEPQFSQGKYAIEIPPQDAVIFKIK